MNEVEGGGAGVGREKKRKAFNSFFAFLNERSLNRHRKNLFFFLGSEPIVCKEEKKKSSIFCLSDKYVCVCV